MKEILLTRGKIALVDDQDFDRLNTAKWRAHKSATGWYAATGTHRSGNYTLMHNEVLGQKRIDHRDCDGLNNQKENLRPCTQVGNSQNARKIKIGSSRFKGVHFYARYKKWMAYICPGGKKIHLGYHPTEEAAAIAYNIEAKRIFGEFARVNEGISC